jgi:glycosyltransferase involved in cell wall biosynthesis
MLKGLVLVAVHLKSNIKFVITVALNQEIPFKELKSLSSISIITLKSINSNNINSISSTCSVLIIITGVGKQNSIQSSEWINHNLLPLFIINWGTCGAQINADAVGSILSFHKFQNRIKTEKKLPFSHSIKECDDVLSSVDAGYLINNPDLVLEDVIPSSAFTDMEAYYQASRLSHFYCIKLVTDFRNNELEFQSSLKIAPEKFKEVFKCLFETYKSSDVSVVIPTFNRNVMLKRAIESCQYQSSPAREIIVVDDGSTDATKDLIKYFNLPNLKYLSLKKNEGVSQARNLGIQNATGSIIALLDSDDVWSVDKLTQQIEYFNKYPFFSIIQSKDEWVRNQIPIIIPKHLEKKEGWIFDDSLLRCAIAPSSVLIIKKIFENSNYFDPTLKACEDYDLWLSLTRFLPIGLDESINLKRFAGHKDQLSIATKLDFCRIFSLDKHYMKEENIDIKESIERVIKKKLRIVINGATKRNVKLEKSLLKIASVYKLPT